MIIVLNSIAPEIYRGEEFNGEKVDIFSLGATLFNLVIRGYGFGSSEEEDHLYKLIKKKKYEEYWKLLNLENISDDLKNLYLRMVAHNP